ncbi:MAG: hypothetical protein JKY51_06260, partial [Opitutaceae bacterium]|nr:hypothetical protein [Opitutaceae bacterium]
NLLGVGVLPLQFEEGVSAATLGLDGSEIISIPGLNDELLPGQALTLEIERADGSSESVEVLVRIDTAIEIDYFRHGGILPFVLRKILKSES